MPRHSAGVQTTSVSGVGGSAVQCRSLLPACMRAARLCMAIVSTAAPTGYFQLHAAIRAPCESQSRVTAVVRALTWRRRWQQRRQPHKEEPVLPATTLHQVTELQHSATDPRLSLLAHPAPRPCLGRSNPGCAHAAGTSGAIKASLAGNGATARPPRRRRCSAQPAAAAASARLPRRRQHGRRQPA